MVSPTDELLAEVAEAEAAGLRAEELNELRGQVEGSGAVPEGMSYQVPDTDKAAWIAAYRMSVDHAGVERGVPTKLAKGQLGQYLSKRRPVDGGRLFTLRMPEHMAAPPIFQCFAAPNFCTSKFDTKANLIDHMLNAHPKESAQMAEEIEIVRKAANKDNVALQEIVRQMAETPDPGTVAVAEAVRASYDAALPKVDETAGTIVEVSMPAPKCALCPWPEGSARWVNEPPTQQALKMHVFAKHRSETE